MSASSTSASRPMSAVRSSSPRRGPASTSSRRSRWRPCRPTRPPWSRRPGRPESPSGWSTTTCSSRRSSSPESSSDPAPLGQVEVVIINYLGVHDYPGNAAYDPTWRHDLARSGGGIFIDIIHLAYLAEALLDRRVERVSAYANARTMGAGVEDLVSSRFETPESAAAHQCRLELRSGRDRRSGRHRGQWHRRSARDHLRERRHVRALSRAPAHGSGRQARPRDDGEGPAGHGAARGAGVRGRSPVHRAPAAPGEDGQRTLEAVMAAYESAALGRTVALPLEPQRPSLSPWRDRPARARAARLEPGPSEGHLRRRRGDMIPGREGKGPRRPDASPIRPMTPPSTPCWPR